VNSIDYLDRGWALRTGRPCLIDVTNGHEMSYDEVRSRTFLIANALRRKGYGPDAKMSVLSGNNADAFVAILGAMRAGITYIPVNMRNTTVHNGDILRRFGCDLLFFMSDLADQAAEIARQCGRACEVIQIDRAGGCGSLEEFVAGCDDTAFELAHDAERTFEILPTSATTGLPKGVIWPNRQLESIVANVMSAAPCDVPPVFLAAAPLTHLAGKFMHYIMAMGGTGVILPGVERGAILDAIPRYGITHLFLPPTSIYDLLADPSARNVDYRSLRYFIYSAAPMAPDKIAEAIDLFGPVMCQIWGQSEAAWCTILLPDDHLVDGIPAPEHRLASCGKPLPFVQVAIMDDGGNLLMDGERGELVVRGNNLMTGYYNDPAETAEVAKHGWHHTGDIGFRDKDGYFHIVDRIKDMIISGGFNIYSAEVETVLLAHPAVLQCAVIGVPDARWGEAVKGVVELKPNATATAAELIAFAHERLGGMKAPKSIDLVDTLPKSAIGKILKREVRARYWGAQERQV
jgi:acyl-CoA synthetase (AMP-forming)/AMP-acid ligase II